MAPCYPQKTTLPAEIGGEPPWDLASCAMSRTSRARAASRRQRASSSSRGRPSPKHCSHLNGNSASRYSTAKVAWHPPPRVRRCSATWRALAEFEEIELYARSLRQHDQRGDGQTLSVAYKSFPLDYLFFHEGNPAFNFIEEFARRSPNLRMTTFSMPDSSILDSIEAGALGAGVVQGSYTRPGLSTLSLGLSETRVIVPRESPLCAKAPLHIADLEGVAIRSPLDLDQFTSRFIERCRVAGFEPSFHIQPRPRTQAAHLRHPSPGPHTTINPARLRVATCPS